MERPVDVASGRSSLATDVVDRVEVLISGRTRHERTWRQIKEVAAPDAGDFERANTNKLGTPTAAETSKLIYDSTAVNAVDRLSSGIEAMVAPQSDYWHGLGVIDFTREEDTDDEARWFERTRNMLFKVRYDPDGGFTNTLQTVIRRSVAFGNAFMYVNDSLDRRSMISYQYLPLGQCYLTEDDTGMMDTFYRVFNLTARQAVRKFGQLLPPDILKAAESTTDSERPFTFVHMLAPRSDIGGTQDGVNGSDIQSVYVSLDHKAVVGKASGFFEMPVIDFRWLPEPGNLWGEGPIARTLADIQSVNLMARNELIASEQSINPALLVANAGVMNPPNSAPGAINFGGVSPTGQALIQPMFQGQRLDFATKVLDAKKNAVRESLMINLFALLVQNPQMSATEAMIRANEKGELLGPAGSRYQSGFSRMVEREIGILTRRGVFERGSAFEVPRTIQGARIGTQFTSPLDRLRHSKEAEGTSRLLEMLSPLAQIDPEVIDAIDPDATVTGLSEILGVPKRFMRKPAVIAAIRQRKAEAAQQAQQAAIAESYAKAGAQATNAMAGMKETGML